MVKITDVAREAGVSVATVSRALNHTVPVNPELAARVQAAVEKLGYRPNGLARNLRKQSAQVWALIITDINNPFYTAVARGVEDVASGAGYSVLLCNSDEDLAKEARYLRVAEQERVTGVIIAARNVDCDLSRLIAARVPLVAIDRTVTSPIDCVLAHSRRGAAMAVRHLLDEGWQRPGCITGPVDAETAEQRHLGYADVVRAHGLPEMVRHIPFHDPGGGVVAAHELLDADDPPDSLFVANSVLALGVLDGLKRRRLRVGRDIGLITFDDAPWCPLLEPSISVVEQPAYEIGTQAGRLLLERISGRPGDRPVQVVLETELIIRDSSRRSADDRTPSRSHGTP